MTVQVYSYDEFQAIASIQNHIDDAAKKANDKLDKRFADLELIHEKRIIRIKEGLFRMHRIISGIK